MKNKLIFIISIIIIVLSSIVIYLLFLKPKSISDYKNSVVKIISYDENYNELSSGSGVASISNDIILTNAHVIEGAKTIEIITNEKNFLSVKGIQYINNESDVAILKLEKAHNLELLNVKKSASVGESIYAVGYSLGILNAISDGIISSIEDMDQYGSVYSHTAPISSGNSGGALINNKGQLIGINFASYDAGQNMNLAIQIDKYIDAYNQTKNNKPLEFEISSLSSTKYFSSKNGAKILGEISSTMFDYLEYGVDKIENVSHFSNHSYSIIGMSFNDNSEFEKIINIEIFEINKSNNNVFDNFKEYVKAHIDDLNYNITDVTLNYYWNCDNNYCYVFDHYNFENSNQIIHLINAINSIDDSNQYEENKIEYIISESKVIQEATDEIPGYTETIIRGENIDYTTKDRFVVGEDVKAGKYDITVDGYADYQVYIGAVVIKLNGSNEEIYMEPYSKTNCYYDEQNCELIYNPQYFKTIKNIVLEDGDIIYVSYPSYSSQSESLKFTAISEQFVYDSIPAKEEIIAPNIKIIESAKKYHDKTQCFINNYLVNKCEVLFNYDELVETFP